MPAGACARTWIGWSPGKRKSLVHGLTAREQKGPMKIACELVKAWLVPYSEGTLRAHRPYLHAVVRRHLRVCPKCRQDEVLLHRTAMALRRHSRSPNWALRRRSKSSLDATLSSRILRAIRDQRPERAEPPPPRPTYPIAAYATAVVLLSVVFAFLTQPTLARPWFSRYFLSSHPPVVRHVKAAPVVPPYPMHDPFVPTFGSGVETAPETNSQVASTPARAWRGAKPSLQLAIETHNRWRPRPALAVRPAPVAADDLQAREAMTAAEAAERMRRLSLPAAGFTTPTPVAPSRTPPAAQAPAGQAGPNSAVNSPQPADKNAMPGDSPPATSTSH